MSQERICGIYKITNTINGKVYIGQSVNIYNRWRQHKQTAANSNVAGHHLPLYSAFREYGTDSFDFEIIEECDKTELNEKEKYYIEKFHSNVPSYGYNARGFTPGEHHISAEKIALIAEFLEHHLLGIIEIASICHTSERTVRRINKGELGSPSHDSFPLNKKAMQTWKKMRHLECRPSIEFRQEHTIEESYIEYKHICFTCFADNEKVDILFDEDIDINLIDRILSDGFLAVSKEYGFKHSGDLTRQLKKKKIPHKISDLQKYYKEQTGKYHPTFQEKLNKAHQQEIAKKKQYSENMQRPIAQYDFHTKDLIAVFLTPKEASEASGIVYTAITGCCKGHRNGKGYIWRYLDCNGNALLPESLPARSKTQQACAACGCEMDSNAILCDECKSIREEIGLLNENIFSFEMLDDLMRRTGQLTTLSVISGFHYMILAHHCKKYGITDKNMEQYRIDYNTCKVQKISTIAQKRLEEALQPWEYYKNQKRYSDDDIVCGIYKIVNSIDGKIFIGAAQDIQRSWNQRKSESLHLADNSPICRDMQVFGNENFTLEVVEECPLELFEQKKREYIKIYRSDNPQYGYNIRKDRTRLTRQKESEIPLPDLEYIDYLLSETGVFINEITRMYDLGHATITDINNGVDFHRDIEYPIRSDEKQRLIHQMRIKQCRPSLQYRMSHTAYESYEEYKRICREHNSRGEKIAILFDEDINDDIITEIVETSSTAVIEKYGYPNRTALFNQIKRCGFPYKMQEMIAYVNALR